MQQQLGLAHLGKQQLGIEHFTQQLGLEHLMQQQGPKQLDNFGRRQHFMQLPGLQHSGQLIDQETFMQQHSEHPGHANVQHPSPQHVQQEPMLDLVCRFTVKLQVAVTTALNP
ncbi:hypothetical protein TanjilG_16061 [Lupinus angustifolius]|uniref:Uncharacterized protein n=1 Tax=Lupinus angustifolius TaxID=3871 RepID=A0A4P1RH97_LUPAN|nr:hypothetical protein TanjilG_16061 [Lupinus angustifolius]